MAAMGDDAFRDSTEAYALGALDERERSAYEAHLASGCPECQSALDVWHGLVPGLAAGCPRAVPDPALKQQVLDLAEAPVLPLDLDALEWNEVVPGIRLHVLREDPARNLRACLAWGKPGARNATHRHRGGDEVILVLQGALRDERGVYRAGDVCRSRAESAHSEEVLPGEDCICYVLYYGVLEPLEA
jgi:anti-sigma factor ChrR (cupin superfamily)